jgi:hypothetical protein
MRDPWGLFACAGCGGPDDPDPCGPFGATQLFGVGFSGMEFCVETLPVSEAAPDTASAPSCSIGIRFNGDLSPEDMLSFEFGSPNESRKLGPNQFGPPLVAPLGWFYRVEVFGSVGSNPSQWRIRQDVQTYLFAEFEDGSTEGPFRDTVFHPDRGGFYDPSRVQITPGQGSFFAIDGPGQGNIRSGKKIKSMTLLYNFITWPEFNVQGLGIVCDRVSWHVKINIKNYEIKELSAGLGHVDI